MNIRNYILALGLILLANTSIAQWTKTGGPFEVNAMVIEPYHSKLFLGTSQSGLFKSTNNAATWTRVNSFPDSASIYGIPKVINLDDTLFAATFNHIYKSDDSGATWLYADDGIPDTMYNFNLYNANDELYATAYDLDWVTNAEYTHVYHYNVVTMQWNEMPNLPQDAIVRSIAALHDTVFMAVAGHGIYKTHNNGSSWDSINATLGSINTNEVSLLASNGTNIYALGILSGTELFSSANGISWSSSVINILGYNEVKVFCVSHDTLLLGSPGAVTASFDGGNNWSLYSLPKYYDFQDLKFIGNRMYAADKNTGVNYSTTASLWLFANNGLPYSTNLHLANPFSNLYAMDYFSTFHSSNSANTWTVDTNLIWNIHAMARMGNKLLGFTGSSQDNLISWDQGATWKFDTGYGVSIVVTDVLVDNDHHKAYAIGQNDVRRSDDYGVNWHPLFYPNGFIPHDTTFTSIARIKNRLFVSIFDTVGKLIYSDDFGANWELDTNVSNVYKVVGVDTTLVVGTASGIKSSTDLGNVFQSSFSPVLINNTFVNGRTLFSYGLPMLNNIYYSPDYGMSWIDISDTSVSAVYSLAMDNTYLYAGTQANSVWRMPLSSQSLTYTPDTSNNYTVSVSGPTLKGCNTLAFYPNPFNSQINIALNIQSSRHVSIKLYDALGRCIEHIADAQLSAGQHSFMFKKDVPSGIYFVIANMDGEMLSGKVIKQ